MNIEEAGEIILRGHPWLVCHTCDATGYVRIEGGKGTDACHVCNGFTRIIDPAYEEACKLLDRPLPEYNAYDIPLAKLLEMNSMRDIDKIKDLGFNIVIEDDT